MLIRILEKNQDSRDVPLAAGALLRKRARKGGFVRCHHKSHRASPRVHESKRLRSLSTVFLRSPRTRYARSSGISSRRSSVSRSRDNPDASALVISAIRRCVARVRRTPVSDALRRRSSRPRRDGFFSRWSSTGRPSRGPNGGSRSARDSTSRVCHGTPISSMGFVDHALFVRSVGPPARALELGIATRARRSGTTIVSSSLARLAFSARARAGLTSARARRPSEFRSGSLRGGGNIRGNVALGADFRLESATPANEVARGTKSIALLDVDRFPRHETIASRLTPLLTSPFPFPPSLSPRSRKLPSEYTEPPTMRFAMINQSAFSKAATRPGPPRRRSPTRSSPRAPGSPLPTSPPSPTSSARGPRAPPPSARAPRWSTRSPPSEIRRRAPDRDPRGGSSQVLRG